jgi:glycerol dehydrogenase-like iron-containing ADH family enzyme
MKPNLTTFPKTDCNYTAITLTGNCAKRVAAAHSFRHIGDDYFKSEAPHCFAGEGAFFAVIVMSVAAALLSNVSALHDFVRAIGAA